MKILGIDPGTTQSGYVLWDTETNTVVRHGIKDNSTMLNWISILSFDLVGIENVALYQLVGKDIRDTIIWIGRLFQAFVECSFPDPTLIERSEIKMHFCGHLKKIGDPAIRLALIDRFGSKGTKKNPGVFYGFKDHEWAAAAVAICLADKTP